VTVRSRERSTRRGVARVVATRSQPKRTPDLVDWPNGEASRFVDAAGLRWHVQTLGHGPALLLLHGTGAATHSWRDLAPLLADAFTVVAPDLPGHGFTSAPPPPGFGLPEMAAAIGDLLRRLRIAPVLAVGHSAGAAILARMCLDGRIAPRVLVSLNGALLPLHGLAGHIFTPLARLLAANDVVSRIFAWRARDRTAVERLIRRTGSTLDASGVDLYARLVRNPRHVRAALEMMANWDLHPLERELPRLAPQLVLVTGENDLTVPPGEAERVRALVATARLESLPGLGHLAHEERPEEVAALVRRVANAAAPAC
jgi:magnesium chelatase accessory protein